MGRRDHHGRSDLRKAAVKRLLDAKALHARGRAHGRGAMYLAGYAIECKLKAIALEVYNCWTLEGLAAKWGVQEQDVYTHGLEAFASRLPLYRALRSSDQWVAFARLVNRWRPSWRYDPTDPVVERQRDEAGDFIQAVNRLFQWLDANQS